MNQASISVAMATYNGEAYIVQQIESILRQTHPVDEIIIVDDGSTDRTVDYIRQLNCPLIRLWQNETNLGYIENFYKALAQTTGAYIFLADQDDIWEPDKVEQVLSVLQGSEETMAVCTGFTLIDAAGNPIPDARQYQINPFVLRRHKPVEPITLHRLAFGNVLQGCTYGLRRAVVDAYLQLHNAEVIHDYQLMLIAASMGRVLYLNEPLIRYRLHGNNAVGFGKKERRIELPNHKASREPFMARFFKQMDTVTPVPHKRYYLFLYYCRIPYIKAILKRAFCGG